MPEFTSHIFVCCNQREPGHPRGCCDRDGQGALRECFKQELLRRKLGVTVRANKAGCLDQCELGPTVVIYPQQIWYGRVQPEDVPRIIDETILGGRVLEDLLIDERWLNTKGRGPGQPNTAGNTEPQETAPQETVPQITAAENTASKNTVSENTVSENTVPEKRS